METVVLVMMILVCFNYMLKQTYRKIYSVMFSATICALFIGCMWPYAIEQSKTQISSWLANSQLMLNLSVILTLEVALQMTFCILSAHIQTAGKVKPRTVAVYRLLRWFPGMLIFPVLFSLLVSSIFALPGVSFSGVAWTLAALVFVTIPLGSWLIRWILPEKEIRLELLFLANALIAILGVIASVNGRTAVAGVSEVNENALVVLIGMLAAGLLIGSLTYSIKLKRISKINR